MSKYLVQFIFGTIWQMKKRSHNSKIPLIRKLNVMAYNFSLGTDGSYIGINAIFKKTPVFPHGLKGIFISGEAIIGENCIIYQHVTIGSNTIPFSKGLGSPKIEDNCFIGAGAKIIGGILIGENSRIGANCVVTFDVPPNSVVVLGKPTIFQKENLDNRCYFYKGDNNWAYMISDEQIDVRDEEILNELNNGFSKNIK